MTRTAPSFDDPAVRWIRRGLFPVLVLLVAGPFLVLLVASLGRGWFYPDLLPESPTLENWAFVLEGGGRLGRATLSSLVLATGTGILAVLISFPAGRALARLTGWRRHVGAAAAFLPVAAPPLALGVGLQYSFLSLGMGGTLTGVMLAHLVPAAGYVSLFFLGIFSVHDDRLEVEARSLGAGPLQVLMRVTLPVLRRPLMEGAVLGFLISWAQVPLTLVVGQGVVPALPLEVFAFLQAGQDPLAATGALLLVVPPILAMAGAGLALRRVKVVAL